MHILYVAAATKERAEMVKRLRRSRYQGSRMVVHAVSSIREATRYLREHPVDACLVDLATISGSPGNILQRLRRAGPDAAFILAVTSQQKDVPQADSTILKPFTVRMFKARLTQALSNRKADILCVGPFSLDTRTRKLTTPHGTFQLRPLEARLLREFMQHPNEVLSRQYLTQKVWETSYLGDTRTLDVHIHWLRKKIEEDAGEPRYIITVYGLGYKFQVEQGELEEDEEGTAGAVP